MSSFRWLHLTDLHFGMAGQSSLWPNFEEIFLNDLKFLYEDVGPWDVVIFTGDLTQCGSKDEFSALDVLLQKMWSSFKDWGFCPKLVAIPGNHDLVRPKNRSDPTLITLLHNWNLPEVHEPFWEDEHSLSRKLINEAFQPFTEWRSSSSLPQLGINAGLLPGDFSTTYNAGDFKVGLVGLNTAFLQLAGGDFEGKLHLDTRQFQEACGGHAPDWLTKHDVCLLLTHHPVSWLEEKSRGDFLSEIHAPPERFALHMFGHMHEANLSSLASGGGEARRTLQGSSLFGLEKWGEKQLKRNHGYSLGELALEGDALMLRIWPRIAKGTHDGTRELNADSSFKLEKKGNCTRPVLVKQLSKVVRRQFGSGVSPAAKELREFDPKNAPFHVPYRQKGGQVVGREDSLVKVRDQLESGKRTSIGQTAVFQGIGGLGKTQLAVEYAYKYRNSYPNGVIWITADQNIDAQLVDLAVKAMWVAPESEHSIKLEIARQRLRSYSDCLIIFDNLEKIESIKPYLPEYPAEPHILATSRSEQPDFNYLPIDVLDAEQSLQLLVQEAGRAPLGDIELQAAKGITQILGGLPLALELVGAYLSRRPVSWQEYLSLLQRNLKSAFPNRLSSLTGHAADLYSTLQISEEVIAEEPLLRDILDVLSWSAPAPMGKDLLAVLADVKDVEQLTGALGLGVALRILRKTPGSERYAIHRLVQEVRREQCPLSERSVWTLRLCQQIADWFDLMRRDFLHLNRYEAEIDHLRSWHECSERHAQKVTSRLTWLQAFPAYHRGLYSEVRSHTERALNEYETYGCDDRALLASLYNDLGYALDKLGRSKSALEYGKQSLAIRRELFGDKNEDTAESLSNIAGCHKSLGNPKYALELGEKCLAVYQEIFGDNHENTASALSSVSNYCLGLGHARRALRLAERALDIRRMLYGERHPYTAAGLSLFAVCCSELGDQHRALALAEQSLAIRRELFGERHPGVANCLNNIASFQNALGNSQKALELAEQAFVILCGLFGEKYPDAITCLSNVATYQSALGNAQRALEISQHALEVRRELFGENHPDVASSLNNIGNCYSELGDARRALEFCEKALRIHRDLLGDIHPDTARSFFNVAALLLELGRTMEAQTRAKTAWEIQNKLLGADHPGTVKTRQLLSKIPGFRSPQQRRKKKRRR